MAGRALQGFRRPAHHSLLMRQNKAARARTLNTKSAWQDRPWAGSSLGLAIPFAGCISQLSQPGLRYDLPARVLARDSRRIPEAAADNIYIVCVGCAAAPVCVTSPLSELASLPSNFGNSRTAGQRARVAGQLVGSSVTARTHQRCFGIANRFSKPQPRTHSIIIVDLQAGPLLRCVHAGWVCSAKNASSQ